TLITDPQGHYVVGSSMATVTPKGGGDDDGGGGAAPPGGSDGSLPPDAAQLLATALVQSVNGTSQGVSARISAHSSPASRTTSPALPLQPSSSQVAVHPQIPVDESYGRILALLLKGDQRLLNPNGWAANELALALGTTGF